jgi:hypothetical protein
MTVRDFMDALAAHIGEDPAFADLPIFVACPYSGDYEWTEPSIDVDDIVPDGETTRVRGVTL